MTSLANIAFQASAQLAMREHNVTPQDVVRIKSASSALEAGGYNRHLARIGSMILRKAGEEGSFAGQLYEKLASVAEWVTAYDQLVGPVADAIAANTDLVKKANPALPKPVGVMGDLIAEAGGGGVSALASLMMLGGVGGASLGALNWHLRNAVQDDSSDNAAIEGEANMYRSMAKQIRNDTRLRHWMTAPKMVR